MENNIYNKSLKKDSFIKVRISNENKELLEIKAYKANLSLSEFIIRSAFSSRIEIYDYKEIRELAKQLSKIGNNLNQSMILAHQGKLKVMKIDEVERGIKETWQLLNLLMTPQKQK